MNEKRGNRSHLRLLVGMLIVVAGVLMLLERMDVGMNISFHTYWPMLLVILGIGKIVIPGHSRKIFTGVALVVVGALFQLKNLGVIYFQLRDLWPLVLVLVGLSFICKSIWAPRLIFACNVGRGNGKHGDLHGVFSGDKREISTDHVDISVLFGSGEYKVTGQQFKGGNASAVFGGIELDLRETEMESDSAVLDVSASFGSVEIRTPSHWLVVLEGSPTLGSMENNTSSPKDAAKKLIVKGVSSFGSVEVRN